MRRISPVVLALGGVALGFAGSSDAAAPSIQLVERARIPIREGPLKIGNDLRVLDDGTFALAAVKQGAVRARLDGQILQPLEVLIPEGGKQGVVISGHLGISSSHVAIASPASQLVWAERRQDGRRGSLGTWSTADAPIVWFQDIDVQGDRLAILGLMGSEKGMSLDGAVAWIGRFPSEGEVRLTPFAYSLAGPGARPFEDCGPFTIGKIRFLDDGRLFLLPGAEPGAYLYSAKGKIERGWDLHQLGLTLRCEFDPNTRRVLTGDGLARLRYVDDHVTVDEAVATSAGPVLFVRSVSGGTTTWKVYLLTEDGGVQPIEANLSSSAPFARLRGDAVGSRLVLLLASNEFWANNPGSELVELELRPFSPPPPSSSRR